MEVDSPNRYRSRILREMNANRQNPFNSPPSSTGSHGTITMSSVLTDPEGESTRKLNEDIARITAPRKLPVNWEAAHRKWPQFYGLPKDHHAPFEDDNETRPMSAESKENNPPAVSAGYDENSTQDSWKGSFRARSAMQPRVDNESDLSILSKSPAPRSLAAQSALKHAHNPSPLAKTHTRSYSTSEPREKRVASYQTATEGLRRSPSSPRDMEKPNGSPHMSSARSSLTAVPPSTESPHSPANNARSFLMPDMSHLDDFVTGTLRFAGSAKNGVPVFVKNGRVHDRQERPSADAHAEVAGLEVPEDEEKIFVSMDMIRDEILSLRDHNDKIQEYAVGLQQEVERLEQQASAGAHTHGGHASSGRANEKLVQQNNHLEMEIASLQTRLEQQSRKVAANEHLTEQNHRLEAEVASLQSHLEQTYRKLSLAEIERDSATQEKDRALRKLQDACEDISKLTGKLSAKRKELDATHRELESTDQMREDNDTLRRDILTLKNGHDALENVNASLRKETKELRRKIQELEQKQAAWQDMTSRSQKFGRDRSRSRSRVSRSRAPSAVEDDFTGVSGFTSEKTSQTVDKEEAKQQRTQNFTLQSQKLRGGDTLQSLWMPQPTETGITDKTTESRPEFVEIDDPSFDSDVEDNEPCQNLDEDRQRQPRAKDVTKQEKKQRNRSRSRSAVRPSMAVNFDLPSERDHTTGGLSCPALTQDARRVLDDLCEHNCQNCTVCTRITHRGVVTPADTARGKKHVTVRRPIPATDRNLSIDDPTMRPSQPPGYALALVIKGLEDEAQHLQLELSQLQARYNNSDKAIGRRERVKLVDSIRSLLKKLEVKNDQIYNLYDVLEGQKVAEQEMTDEEIEMTVLNITGMTVRDMTGGTEQLTWEGIMDA